MVFFYELGWRRGFGWFGRNRRRRGARGDNLLHVLIKIRHGRCRFLWVFYFKEKLDLAKISEQLFHAAMPVIGIFGHHLLYELACSERKIQVIALRRGEFLLDVPDHDIF